MQLAFLQTYTWHMWTVHSHFFLRVYKYSSIFGIEWQYHWEYDDVNVQIQISSTAIGCQVIRKCSVTWTTLKINYLLMTHKKTLEKSLPFTEDYITFFYFTSLLFWELSVLFLFVFLQLLLGDRRLGFVALSGRSVHRLDPQCTFSFLVRRKQDAVALTHRVEEKSTPFYI